MPIARPPRRQQELDHTDQEYLDHEVGIYHTDHLSEVFFVPTLMETSSLPLLLLCLYLFSWSWSHSISLPLALCSGGFAHHVWRFSTSSCTDDRQGSWCLRQFRARTAWRRSSAKRKAATPSTRRGDCLSTYVVFLVCFFRYQYLFLWFDAHATSFVVLCIQPRCNWRFAERCGSVWWAWAVFHTFAGW